MTQFWVLTGVLVLLGMLVVVWPLWKVQRQRSVDRNALNVALYEERMVELREQQTAGHLDEAEVQAIAGEASRLLLEDAEEQHTTRQRARWVPVALLLVALVMPLAVVKLYLNWGEPVGVALYLEMQDEPESGTPQQAISRMERILVLQPDNGEVWFMLGQAYLANDQAEESVIALEKALDLIGEHAQILAALSQSRFVAADYQFDDIGVAMLERALELQPDETSALSLLGVAAFEQGDYDAAIRRWQALMELLEPGSAEAGEIRLGIDRARQLLVQSQTAGLGDEPVIRLRVELDSALQAQLGPDSSVFVFAREAAGGNARPRLLLARRLDPHNLPSDIEMDLTDAMQPDIELYTGQRLELVARLAPAGNVMAGTHEGAVDDVLVGALQPVTLVIDRAL